jgi:hypothetical protein
MVAPAIIFARRSGLISFRIRSRSFVATSSVLSYLSFLFPSFGCFTLARCVANRSSALAISARQKRLVLRPGLSPPQRMIPSRFGSNANAKRQTPSAAPNRISFTFASWTSSGRSPYSVTNSSWKSAPIARPCMLSRTYVVRGIDVSVQRGCSRPPDERPLRATRQSSLGNSQASGREGGRLRRSIVMSRDCEAASRKSQLVIGQGRQAERGSQTRSQAMGAGRTAKIQIAG